MKRVNPKRARIKLSPCAYKELRFQVLRRDGWRCQACGRRENLEVHHKELRSHLVFKVLPSRVSLADARASGAGLEATPIPARARQRNCPGVNCDRFWLDEVLGSFPFF